MGSFPEMYNDPISGIAPISQFVSSGPRNNLRSLRESSVFPGFFSFPQWQIAMWRLYSQAEIRAVIKRCNCNSYCITAIVLMWCYGFSKWKAKEDSTNTYREVTGETSLVKAWCVSDVTSSIPHHFPIQSQKNSLKFISVVGTRTMLQR